MKPDILKHTSIESDNNNSVNNETNEAQTIQLLKQHEILLQQVLFIVRNHTHTQKKNKKKPLFSFSAIFLVSCQGKNKGF